MGKKIALITGASSGIGMQTARLFAQQQIDLILCGRNVNALTTLQAELSKLVNVQIMVFDVQDKKQVIQAFTTLKKTVSKIDILVNNAGNAHGRATFDNGDLLDYDAMIDTNVKGLIYVSHAVLPMLIANDGGHIVNIGSIAGKEVYPEGNVYNASKFAVDALSQAMRMDLVSKNIKVSQVSPGAVKTNFSHVRFKNDNEKASKVYEGWNPLLAEDIADLIYFIVSRKSHVNIADVLILPAQQASATILNKN